MKTKIFLIVLAALAAVVWGIWLFALPESKMARLIEGSVGSESIGIEVEGFEKGIFYSFRAERLALKKSGKPFIAFEEVSGKIRLLPLLSLKAVVTLSGDGGRLAGDITLKRKGYEAAIGIKGKEIDEKALSSFIGLKGKGALTADIRSKDGLGEIKFSVTGGRFEHFAFSGVALPLDLFNTLRGAVSFGGGVVEFKSVAFEGPEAYARIKGSITGGKADLTLELMPERVEDKPIFALLERYKVSPGYYLVPLKGDVGLSPLKGDFGSSP